MNSSDSMLSPAETEKVTCVGNNSLAGPRVYSV